MKAIIATSLLFLASVSAARAQDPGWPRQITKPQGTLVYYQPQVDDWSNFQQLDWHEAISITPTDGKRERLGRTWSPGMLPTKANSLP